MDEFLAGARKAGIDTLDLRARLHHTAGAEGFHALFFRTDQHWKPETGLMASKMIAETLRDDYDMDVDLSHFDLHDYHIDVYHDYFLGSQGKKVTLAKTAPEDISVLKPNFANSLHVTMPEAM